MPTEYLVDPGIGKGMFKKNISTSSLYLQGKPQQNTDNRWMQDRGGPTNSDQPSPFHYVHCRFGMRTWIETTGVNVMCG